MISRCAASILAVGLLVLLTGCPAGDNRPSPGRTLELQEPISGGTYHLYVPSRYTPERRWPLVITCHGTPPFDTAKLQLDEWKGLAEEKGFILAAPELQATSSLSGKNVEEQIRRQAADEQTILAVLRAVQSSHNIEDTRIFLTGWSAGAYTVLYTGLKHPEIFRALAVMQGNFNEAFVEPVIPFIDRYQRVLVSYGNIDPLQEDAGKALEWLKSHDLRPQELQRFGAHKRDPEPVFAFFADCVRHHPYIRLQVRDHAEDPMSVIFSVKPSFQPRGYLWEFGDHAQSSEPNPVHQYREPGIYTVKLALWPPSGRPVVRQIQLQVPRVRLGVTPPSTTARAN